MTISDLNSVSVSNSVAKGQIYILDENDPRGHKSFYIKIEIQVIIKKFIQVVKCQVLIY